MADWLVVRKGAYWRAVNLSQVKEIYFRPERPHIQATLSLDGATVSGEAIYIMTDEGLRGMLEDTLHHVEEGGSNA